MRLSFQIVSLDDASAETKALVVGTLIEALACVDEAYLLDHPETPTFYLAGVSYDVTQEWLDVPALLRSKRGDCKSLVAWRIAEMRIRGLDPRVHAIVTTSSGEDTFHVQIKHAGVIEDPSVRLGMPTP